MRATSMFLALALLAAPAPVIAATQDLGEVEIDGTPVEDEGNPRLHLLGLLGLAGLLGLRRREPTIHVDLRSKKPG